MDLNLKFDNEWNIEIYIMSALAFFLDIHSSAAFIKIDVKCTL